MGRAQDSAAKGRSRAAQLSGLCDSGSLAVAPARPRPPSSLPESAPQGRQAHLARLFIPGPALGFPRTMMGRGEGHSDSVAVRPATLRARPLTVPLGFPHARPGPALRPVGRRDEGDEGGGAQQ